MASSEFRIVLDEGSSGGTAPSPTPTAPTAQLMPGIPIPLPVSVTNWQDQSGGKGPPKTSRPPTTPKNRAPDYIGVVKDYLIGSFRADLPPLVRMLVDESGILKGGKGGVGGGGIGGIGGSSGSGSRYYGSGMPQPVFLTNEPLSCFITNWPTSAASGGGSPAPVTSGTEPDETAVDTLKGGEESGEKAAGDIPVVGAIAIAAAGVVKVGIAAYKAVKEGIESIARAPGELANEAGGIGSSLGRGNNFDALLKGSDAAASALGSIPVVGGTLEASLGSLNTTMRAATSVVDSFVDRGRQLQNYSGPLASANAQADVRSLLSDIREAQQLGPDLAKLTEAQSQLSNELRADLLPLKQAIVVVMTDALKQILEWLPRIEGGLNGLGATVVDLGTAVSQAVQGHAAESGAALAKATLDMSKAINDALEKQRLKAANPAKSLIDTQLDLLRMNRANDKRANDPINDAAPGALNIPAFRPPGF